MTYSVRPVLLIAVVLSLVSCKNKWDEQIAPDSDKDGNSLEGFLNIRWGESLDSAKSKMLARDGISVDSIVLSPSAQLFFSGGKFLGYDVGLWQLQFTDDGFFRGYFIILRKDDTDLITCYKRIKQRVTRSYGKPSNESQEDPGFVAASSSVWELSSGKSKKDYIFLFLFSTERVALTFANGERDPVGVVDD